MYANNKTHYPNPFSFSHLFILDDDTMWTFGSTTQNLALTNRSNNTYACGNIESRSTQITKPRCGNNLRDYRNNEHNKD